MNRQNIVSFEITPELLHGLKRKSKVMDRKRSWIIREAIREYLNRHSPESEVSDEN